PVVQPAQLSAWPTTNGRAWAPRPPVNVTVDPEIVPLWEAAYVLPISKQGAAIADVSHPVASAFTRSIVGSLQFAGLVSPPHVRQAQRAPTRRPAKAPFAMWGA